MVRTSPHLTLPPRGTELLVGLTATVLDGSVARNVEGTPFYVRVTGPSGDTTRAVTIPDPEIGHYSVRVVVPESGVAQIELGIAGSTDLPVLIAGEPIAAGGISSATAQLAPAVVPAPALVPPPPAAPPTVPVGDVAGTPVGPMDATAAVTASARPAPPPWIAVIGSAAAVLTVIASGVLLAARRLRAGRRPGVPGRTARG